MRTVLDSSVLVAALVTPNPASASRIILAGEAKGLVARDPADDMVLAAAIGGRAGWVVSLDRDLLDLAEVEGVRILRPGDFLVELRRLDG